MRLLFFDLFFFLVIFFFRGERLSKCMLDKHENPKYKGKEKGHHFLPVQLSLKSRQDNVQLSALGRRSGSPMVIS